MGIRSRKRGNSLGMLILNFVLICAIIINGTYAWIHIGQSVNGALLYINEEHEVILEKYEKDADGNIVVDDDGAPIPMENVGFAIFIDDGDGNYKNDEQIGDIRYTDDEGKISATVPVGNFYFEEVYYPSGYGADKDEDGEYIYRYEFTITGNTTSDATSDEDVSTQEDATSDENTSTVEEDGGTGDADGGTGDADGGTGDADGGTGDADGATGDVDGGTGDVDGATGDADGATVDGDDSTEDEIKVIRVYNRPLETSLDIEKLVENYDGTDLTEDQKNQEFEFTVTIGDENSYNYYIMNDDGSYATGSQDDTSSDEGDGDIALASEYIEEIEEGVYSINLSDVLSYTYSETIDIEYSGTIASGDKIYLKHGQVAVIEDIPMDTYYQVSESRLGNYYTETENVSGNIIFGSNKAQFVNIYDDVNGRLRITKEVQGDDFDPDKEFEFTATIGEGDSQEVFTFSLKDGETYLLYEIPVGTTYSIVETDYVDEKYYASVLSYEGIIMDAVEIELPFINVYDPVEQLGDLVVLKEVIYNELSESEELESEELESEEVEEERVFSFEVTFENPDDPENPFVVDFDLADGEFEVFANRTFGTKYTVREVGSNGYLPDYAEVTGYITGKKLDESLEYDTELTFEEQDMQLVIFVNREPDIKDLVVTKIVDGDVPHDYKEKEFEFTLLVDGEKTVFYLIGGESVTFELPIYTEYEITETDYTGDGFIQSITDNSSGIIQQNTTEVLFINKYTKEKLDIEGEKTWDTNPDATEFIPESITVYLMRVNEDGADYTAGEVEVFPEDGIWKYAFQVDKNDASGKPYEYYIEEAKITNFQQISDEDSYDIYNQYVEEIILDIPTVEKQIIGTASTNNQFAFTLTIPDKAPVPSGVAKSSEIVKMRTGAGDVNFGSISITEAGTFTYTITEVNDGLEDWIYDETIYTFEVVVELVEGKLTIVKMLDDGKDPAEKAVFVNEYIGDDAVDPDDEDEDDDLGATHMYVEGSKIWDHGLNSAEHQPSKLVVYILGDGEVYQAVETSASKNWSYKFGVPKRNEDGEEITYTIGEEPVEGYNGVAIGYDLYNTFDLSSLVEPDSPQTSDYSQIWIWVWGLAASTVTFVYVNRRKRVLRHGRRW